MPREGIGNVAHWTHANPDCSIRLWIDGPAEPDIAARYRQAGLPMRVELIDIATCGLATTEIRYELDGLCPNFGATSDLLRYAILAVYGGMYIDCLDVLPHAHSRLGDLDFRDDTLLLHRSRHAVAPPGGPSTEAMLCSPHHPRMQALADAARGAYRGPHWSYKRLRLRLEPPTPSSPQLERLRRWEERETVSALEFSKKRALDTLVLTGPAMALRLLRGNAEQLPDEYVVPLDLITEPTEHALSWGPLRVLARPYDAAIAAAVGSIRFEADHMRLFNPVLHVAQIAASVNSTTGAAMTAEQVAQIQRDLFTSLRPDTDRFAYYASAGLSAEPLRQLTLR